MSGHSKIINWSKVGRNNKSSLRHLLDMLTSHTETLNAVEKVYNYINLYNTRWSSFLTSPTSMASCFGKQMCLVIVTILNRPFGLRLYLKCLQETSSKPFCPTSRNQCLRLLRFLSRS